MHSKQTTPRQLILYINDINTFKTFIPNLSHCIDIVRAESEASVYPFYQKKNPCLILLLVNIGLPTQTREPLPESSKNRISLSLVQTAM